jgi:multidrug efflux system outer membrane protein
LRDYARLARLRYDNGFTSYLEVTDADTKLFNADLQYTQSQGQLFFALINVYKSMGGGWVVEADRMTSGIPADAAAVIK